MKLKTKKNSFLGYLVLAVLIVSCSKDDGKDGAIGPQGAQGEQGPAGAAGTDGEDGAQGETGAANVIYSDWFDSELGDGIGTASSFTFDAPELTQEIMDSGIILMYAKTSSAESVYPLPITFSSTTINETYYFRSEGVTAALRIWVRQVDVDGVDVETPYLSRFRYVLIPRGSLVSGKSSSIDYSKMSYEKIVQHFNISK